MKIDFKKLNQTLVFIFEATKIAFEGFKSWTKPLLISSWW